MLNPTPIDFSSRLACYSSESELLDSASSDFCFPSNGELIRGIMHMMEMSQAEGPELLIMHRTLTFSAIVRAAPTSSHYQSNSYL
ncbi:hypothetical protein VNO80_07760 [Phaseolus coccineus]|uniref:Uncharacterized protein n=1 Tax=Phaseolus coccineus TaxID=3886 RepID=A0AAN9NP10_PHACN